MKKYRNLLYLVSLLVLMSFEIQGERFVTSQGTILFNSDAPFELIQANCVLT